MRQFTDRFADLRNEIYKWESVAEDPDTIEAARRQREGAVSELTEITLDSAYRRHLAQTVEEIASESETRSCSCTDMACELKRGELPARVDLEDTIEDGITQHRAEHDGDCHALTVAREDWVSRSVELEETMTRSITTLRRDEGRAITPTETDAESDDVETVAEAD